MCGNIGLNPCFSGLYTPTGLAGRWQNTVQRLNPCFSGLYTPTGDAFKFIDPKEPS